MCLVENESGGVVCAGKRRGTHTTPCVSWKHVDQTCLRVIEIDGHASMCLVGVRGRGFMCPVEGDATNLNV